MYAKTYWLIAVAFRIGQLQCMGVVIILLWFLWYFLPRARATLWSTERSAVELDKWSEGLLFELVKAVSWKSELKSIERSALPVEWDVDKAVIGETRCRFPKWLQENNRAFHCKLALYCLLYCSERSDKKADDKKGCHTFLGYNNILGLQGLVLQQNRYSVAYEMKYSVSCLYYINSHAHVDP